MRLNTILALTSHRKSPFASATCSSQLKNNYFTEMCSGSEAGSYSRLIDFVHPSMRLNTIEALTGHRKSPFASATCSSQLKNNYFTEMCSGSEAGSYSRLTDFKFRISDFGFRDSGILPPRGGPR